LLAALLAGCSEDSGSSGGGGGGGDADAGEGEGEGAAEGEGEGEGPGEGEGEGEGAAEGEGEGEGESAEGEGEGEGAVEDAREQAWVQIPGGEFEMGCSPDDGECEPRELPTHTVTVEAFQLAETEVTNAQYAAFLTDNGNECEGVNCINTSNPHPEMSESGGTWTANPGRANDPLFAVTWHGARAFCAWAGGRLPSEGEWEYAARAGTTTKFTCGDEEACLDDIACWKAEAPCPVASKDANAFGLYDMLGGMWEWVEDCFHETYDDAPATGDVWEAGEGCQARGLRGGQYGYSSGESMRVSRRQRFFPTTAATDWGFRCAKD